jgi:hypothetical protein
MRGWLLFLTKASQCFALIRPSSHFSLPLYSVSLTFLGHPPPLHNQRRESYEFKSVNPGQYPDGLLVQAPGTKLGQAYGGEERSMLMFNSAVCLREHCLPQASPWVVIFCPPQESAKGWSHQRNNRAWRKNLDLLTTLTCNRTKYGILSTSFSSH